jgi:hypothetical protein
MTIVKKFIFNLALALGVISLVPVVALAQANVNTSASTTIKATVKLGATETKAKERANQEIDRRVKALTALAERIQAMQKVTDAFKQGVNATVANEITALNNLKAKIDADTDTATLKTDIQSITKSYRIFALVMQQIRIAAAADREVVLVSMMSTLGSKLQARIQTAGQSGADVSQLMTALNNMAAKLQEAQAKAQAAVSVSATLTPDDGDAAKLKSNNAALAEARADLKAAMKSITEARKDAATIISGLAKLNAATQASTTTTVTP